MCLVPCRADAHAACLNLWVGKYKVDRIDGTTRKAGLLGQRGTLINRSLLHEGFHKIEQCRVMLNARRIAGKSWIASDPITTRRMAENAQLSVVAYRKHHVTIGAGGLS